MAADQPLRRMPLRELIDHAERSSRHVIEHLHGTLLAQISDFRDLCRPVRRRGHYPTLISIQHAVESLLAAEKETDDLVNDLKHQLEEIGERALKERVNRL